MNPVFIFDINVVVAGLITSHIDSPVARILDGMLHPSFRFAMSDALLAEYRGVLLRPQLSRLHRLAEPAIDTILTTLTRHAIVLPVPPQPNALVAPDVGDQFLWELLTNREDLMLFTGAKLLLQTGPVQARIMAPLEFAGQVLGNAQRRPGSKNHSMICFFSVDLSILARSPINMSVNSYSLCSEMD